VIHQPRDHELGDGRDAAPAAALSSDACAGHAHPTTRPALQGHVVRRHLPLPGTAADAAPASCVGPGASPNVTR
jgi:hypothetical protein